MPENLLCPCVTVVLTGEEMTLAEFMLLQFSSFKVSLDAQFGASFKGSFSLSTTGRATTRVDIDAT
jgi:hypothetical protein